VVTFIQAAIGISPFEAVGLAIVIYKFVKRVKRNLNETMWSILSMRSFAIWTMMVWTMGFVTAFAVALMVFVLTSDIVTSLVYFLMMVGFVVFFWLIPFIIPAAEETIRKELSI
jgi:hypothetical protein